MRHCGLNDNFGAVFGENLQKNKNLVSVDFSHNLLTSHTLKFLAQSIKMNTGRLETLNLSHNMLDDSMGTKLIEALKHNSVLYSLDLSSNNLQDATAKQALSLVMHSNNSLKVHLRHNMITPMLVDKIEHLSSKHTVVTTKDDVKSLQTTKLKFKGVSQQKKDSESRVRHNQAKLRRMWGTVEGLQGEERHVKEVEEGRTGVVEEDLARVDGVAR